MEVLWESSLEATNVINRPPETSRSKVHERKSKCKDVLHCKAVNTALKYSSTQHMEQHCPGGYIHFGTLSLKASLRATEIGQVFHRRKK